MHKPDVMTARQAPWTSVDMVVYEALNPAIAFFMSFMLFMVKHVLGSGRRPVCELGALCGASYTSPKVRSTTNTLM